ncbi:hypothetical protein AAG906_030758 [Vitis piasezkii]
MRSNAKHLTHDAVIARFEPYLYPLDVSYQNINERRLFYGLLATRKKMVDVDFKMFHFVMPNVPCQPNDNDCGVFIMKFMDNWSNGGLSKSIDVSIPLRLQGFYRFSLETPTFNAIAAISWLRSDHLNPVRRRLAEKRGLTLTFSLPWRNIRGTSEVYLEEANISTLVRAFYSRVTYGHGGPIISIVRGVRSSGLGEHMSRIDVGYLMMMHMMACYKSSTHVIPYSRFLTRVFKDTGVDLSKERDFEAPSSYDTYDEQSLGRMKFEKAPDGSWIRRAERPASQHRGQGEVHPAVEEEIEIQEMEGGLDPQRDFNHRETEFDLPLQ